MKFFSFVLQRRKPRLLAIWFMVAFTTILPVESLTQAQTLNSAINNLFGDIRAQGGTVEIGTLENGKGQGDVRLTDLKISFPRDKQARGLQINFAKLDLTGVRSDESRIVIDQARGERARIESDAGKVVISRFSIEKMSVPKSTSGKKAGERPFQSFVESLTQIVKTEFKEISIDDVQWELSSNPPATLTLARFSASNSTGGSIARVALTQLKRVEQGAEKSTGAEAITIEGLNPAQLIDILKSQGQSPTDPSNENREWKALANAVTIQSYFQTEKTARTEIAEIQLSGLRLRRFAIDPAAFFDLASTTPAYLSEHPEEARKFGQALMDVVKLDRAKLSKLSGTDGQVPVPRRFGVESIAVEDLDPLNAQSITLLNIEDHRGESGLAIRRVALSRLELLNSVENAPTGGAPVKIPVFGGVVIEDLKFVQPGALIELNSLIWDAPTHSGIFPTKLTVTIAGLNLPVGLVPDPAIRADLVSSGVTTLPMDADLSANFDDVREQLDLDHFSLNVGNLARIDLRGSMTGLSKAGFDNVESLKSAMFAASIKGVKLKYTDAGLAGHVINAIAAANKQPPEQIRKALTANMPTFLGSVPDASTRNTLIFALIGFLSDPQIIEFSTLAQDPVPVAAVATALREAPATIPVLLKLNATATRKH